MTKKHVFTNLLLILCGTLLQAFAIYNIHSVSGVTEGGMIGLELLLKHWLNLSPAISSAVLSVFCYLLAFRTFGTRFLIYSAVSVGSYSAFYAILEQFPRLYPEISEQPLLAALAGAVLIGVGAGLCVRAGGATSGDDALAMALGERLHVPLRRIYLVSDLAVLALSLTYIPLRRIAYSLLTVVLSGLLVGWVAKKPEEKALPDTP